VSKRVRLKLLGSLPVMIQNAIGGEDEERVAKSDHPHDGDVAAANADVVDRRHCVRLRVLRVGEAVSPVLARGSDGAERSGMKAVPEPPEVTAIVKKAARAVWVA